MFRIISIFYLIAISYTLSAQIDDNRISTYQVMQQDSFMAAMEYFNNGKLEDAEKVLKNLIFQDHTQPAFEFILAKVYWNKKDKNEAINHAQKAATLDHSNIWYRLLEAEFLDQSGRINEATQEYEQIVNDFPRVQEYWIKLSRLYQTQGKANDAVSLYDRMIAQFGESDELLLRKAQTMSEMNDLKGAIQVQTRLVQRNPDNTGFKNNLASLYVQSGDTATANKLFREVLLADPNDSRANIAMAETLRNNNRNEAYLDAISTLMANREINIDLKISELIPYLQRFIDNRDTALGQALIRSGKQLVQAHSDPKAYAILGDIYFQNGDYLLANTAYDQSLNLTKKAYSVFQQKMLILTYLKRYEEQLDFTEMTLDAYPNQVDPYFYQALAYLKVARTDEAMNDLQQALMIAGKNHPLSATIAALYSIIAVGKNDPTNANKFKLNAINYAGSNAPVRNEVAELWADYGMWLDEAKELNETALKSDPSNPFYLSTQARIEFKQNNIKEAKKLIDQALSNHGDLYPAILELTGDIASKQNNTDAAIKYWNLAKNLGVKSTVLEQKIAQKIYKPG